MCVDELLVDVFSLYVACRFDDCGSDDRLLHEVFVKGWITELRNDIDESRIAVLHDLRFVEASTGSAFNDRVES